MNEAEFYSRAQSNASFRQQQREETLYQKKLAQVGFALLLVAYLGYAAFCWFLWNRWPDPTIVIISLLFCIWNYSHARTRLAALEAISSTSNRTQPAIAPLA